MVNFTNEQTNVNNNQIQARYAPSPRRRIPYPRQYNVNLVLSEIIGGFLDEKVPSDTSCGDRHERSERRERVEY